MRAQLFASTIIRVGDPKQTWNDSEIMWVSFFPQSHERW